MKNKFNFIEVKKTKNKDDIFEFASTFKDAKRKFLKNKLAIIGTIIFILLILLSIIFSFLPNYNVSTLDDKNISQWPPTLTHWLGTDAFGRDLWSRIWGGILYSLQLAIVTTTLNVLIAIAIGLLMGYFEKFDKLFSYVIKVLYALPTIIILILFSVIFHTNNPKLAFWVIVISLTFSGWVNASQQIRGVTLKTKNLDFITASQTLGTKRFFILKTFFIYSLPTIIIQYSIIFPRMIISESILGFLGLSVPDVPTLGNLINDGKLEFLNNTYQLLFPLASLVITTISIQFIGMGIEDALSEKGEL